MTTRTRPRSTTAPAGRSRPSVPVLVTSAVALAVAAGAVTVVATSYDPTPAGTGDRAAASASPSTPTETPTTPPTAGQQWQDAARRDFFALNGVVVDLLRTVKDWQAGSKPAAATGAQALYALSEFQNTRAALAARTPFPQAPEALTDYRATAALYIAYGRLVRAATLLPSGPLQQQLLLASSRSRNLGDRLFDASTEELAAYLPPPRDIEGVEIRKPAEVPDWRGLKLAAGPPLSVPQPPRAPREYQKARPEQSFARWRDLLAAQAVPTPAEEAQAIRNGSVARLAVLADRFTRASDALHAAGDPQGGRVLSTRIQLALLVHAEAARAAQAARLAPGPARTQLQTTAEALALTADTLWDDRLGARSTGLDAASLTA